MGDSTPTPPRLSRATRVVHPDTSPQGDRRALIPPLPMSSVFGHGNSQGYSYGRDNNENWQRLEALLTDLEEGDGALVFGSGMAAIAAVIQSCGIGRRIVAARDAYTGTRELLRHLAGAGQCAVEFVDATDLDAVARACQGASLLHIETLGNPLLTVPDLRACAEIAHQVGAVIMVDNTFATPLLVQPLTLGADIVVHSASKYIGGHSDLLMGAVIANAGDLLAKIRYQRSNAGAIPGQLESWLALRGLRTLDVRLRRQTESAMFLAQRLAAIAGVARVHYPGLAGHPQHELAVRQMRDGFGAMISVELDCDAATAERFCAATRIWTNSTSLGSVESLLERRARWAGEEYLPAGLVRMSVGIEAAEDLLEDLTQALIAAGVGAAEGSTVTVPLPAD
ncbi:MAG: aminotransferase class I/II-fold pyridoxal phosphate-dependent enzyme [Candidatus Dormiibacterota bacterium]